MSREFARALNLRDVPEEFKQRFWSKVDVREADECWEWMAYRKPSGYGQFTLRKGVFITASRVALALSGVVIEPGIVACHKCDNPPCCNPSHLFAGDQSDNANDCVAKGRANRSRGMDHLSARLTPEKVAWARRQNYSIYGERGRVARHLGITPVALRRAVTGVTWAHLDEPPGVWPKFIGRRCVRMDG